MRTVINRPSSKTADTGRMWTPGIWDDIPWDAIVAGTKEGNVFFDDFHNVPDMVTGSNTGIYATFNDATSVVSQAADDEHGALVMTTDADDNQEIWITTGGNKGGAFKFIKPSAATPHIIAFECRYKISSITTGSSFIGFGEEGLAAGDTLTDAGVIADKDVIGFYTPEADPDGMDFAYMKESGTLKINNSDVHTWVADTYVKAGFVYDYRSANDKQISVWINGIRQATYVSKTLIEVTADFPAGEELALLAGHKNVTDIETMTIDWWKAAQVVNT